MQVLPELARKADSLAQDASFRAVVVFFLLVITDGRELVTLNR